VSSGKIKKQKYKLSNVLVAILKWPEVTSLDNVVVTVREAVKCREKYGRLSNIRVPLKNELSS
jgi:hypothetical protein